jgi:hypothetical protein
MISMSSCITMIFGIERVDHIFIEIIHFIDEKEKNMIFIVDKITLYSNRKER